MLKNLASIELLKYTKKYFNINKRMIEKNILILFPKYTHDMIDGMYIIK